jgi:hypothetical protein
VLEVNGRQQSKQLGVATFAVQFEVLRELLAAGVSAICEGNFGASWFDVLPPARIVQVHLTAPPEVLVARLVGRSEQRHPVHYDREASSEVLERAAAGEWAPLDIGGELIVVETEEWPDFEPIVSIVARFVSR